jgi:hypothetical protein
MIEYIPFIHKIEKETYKETQLPLYDEYIPFEKPKQKEEDLKEEKRVIIIEL